MHHQAFVKARQRRFPFSVEKVVEGDLEVDAPPEGVAGGEGVEETIHILV